MLSDKKQSFLIFLIIISVSFASKRKISTIQIEEGVSDVDVTPYTYVGNKLLYFGQSKVSWYKANLICRSMNGFLVSIDCEDDIKAISNYLLAKQSKDRWWWISGSDVDSEGDFFSYKTGERISYANWSKSQPDNDGGHEDCMHLWLLNDHSMYTMNDWVCHNKAYFICEKEGPLTFLTTIY